MSDQTASKVQPIEAWIGSDEWVRTVQEGILDTRSLCFVCGDEITYRLDFFYMRGRMGTVMMHDKCFSPIGKKSKGRVVYIEANNPATYSKEAEVNALAKMDWWTLDEAAEYLGISYNALYQRLWQKGKPGNALESNFMKKSDGRWYITREHVQGMHRGKAPLGRPPVGSIRKNRMWRSEVTEEISRISSTEAARRIGASRGWVLQRKDQFDAVKVGDNWRLSEAKVDEYVRAEEERDGGASAA